MAALKLCIIQERKMRVLNFKKEIAEFVENHKIKSIGIAHANVIEFVDKVKHQFTESFDFENYDVNVTTPVVSTHTGQGAIGLVVLRD